MWLADLPAAIEGEPARALRIYPDHCVSGAFSRLRASWKLNHRRAPTGANVTSRHHRAIGKFKHVTMRPGLVEIDPLEASDRGTQSSPPQGKPTNEA
jgi:hypothetical protein